MTPATVRVAMDLSCALDYPLTGVGYRALYITQALRAQSPELDLRMFATRARCVNQIPEAFQTGFSRHFVVPYARKLKHHLWRRFDWPPIEWFCGEVDVAHGLFHELPAAKKAVRLVTIHDLSFFKFPETHTAATIRIHSAMLYHSARAADACITVSQSCKRDLMEVLKFPEDRIFVVPGGVNIEEFAGSPSGEDVARLKAKLGLTRPYFIHLGTIEPRKNIPRLLEAYNRLRSRRQDCPQLLLVGAKGWLYEPIFEKLASYNFGNDVVYAGYLSRREAVLALKTALASVYPSMYEGFGLPVLESMAAGTPVICSNAASLPEVIGNCGLLTPPSDVDALEAAMENVLEHPGAASQRAEAAMQRAQAMTWSESARELAAVYRMLAIQTAKSSTSA
ncbi:MAG: glycosyltransferase family 4 protein, partial [Candidatus Hydrogenedentes bacterium]|nr:glycosyltransferase family 4 protein [Candidatus Hydrogenedentota bacterium]